MSVNAFNNSGPQPYSPLKSDAKQSVAGKKRVARRKSMYTTTGHVGGMHLVVYGLNKGACMCLSSCCYDDELGCVCRSCNGVNHSACVPLNVKRNKDRAYRETARARAQQRESDMHRD